MVIAACTDLIADVVIAGHDRNEVCALIFPKVDACQQQLGSGELRAVEGLITRPEILDVIRAALETYNEQAGGSSNRIARAAIMLEPPSVDAGEITDKGYLNQRCVLERRADMVDRLYAPDRCVGVIEIESVLRSRQRA
jgi:feruloyl-CoA synthase